MNRKVALLDRDGVVNVDIHYLHRPEDLIWTDGAPRAIRLLNERGYDVIIVTNQAGIARGYYSEVQFAEFSKWLENELLKEGALIRKTLYCPHHPVHGLPPYNVDCECRKPKPGMVLEALAFGDYEKEASFLIGDNDTDVEAAVSAGVRGFRFFGGSLLEFVQAILAAEPAGT